MNNYEALKVSDRYKMNFLTAGFQTVPLYKLKVCLYIESKTNFNNAN